MVSFTLKTHLLLIFLRPRGNGASSHVLFLRRDSNPESHASFHLLASLDSIADFNDDGKSSTEYTTRVHYSSSSSMDVIIADMSARTTTQANV